jgi:hypothetical protein
MRVRLSLEQDEEVVIEFLVKPQAPRRHFRGAIL